MKNIRSLPWVLAALVGFAGAVYAANTCNRSDIYCYKTGPSQNVTTVGRLDSSGNLFVTGNSSTTGTSTFIGAMVPSPQSVAVVGPTIITPVSSYLILLASQTVTLAGTPTISTAVAPNGAAYPDGMFLIITGTSTTSNIVLQDNAALSGSQLFMQKKATGGGTQTVISSTQTAIFQYNAANTGWNLIH